jgi:hypothetical protein
VAASWLRRDDLVTGSTHVAGEVRVLVLATAEEIAAVPLFSSLDEDQLERILRSLPV